MQTTKDVSPYQQMVGQSAKDILHCVFQLRKQINESNVDSRDLAYNEESKKIARKRSELVGLFSDLCRPLALKIIEPPVPGFRFRGNFQQWLNETNEVWIDQLLAQMKYDSIGTYHFLGEREIVYTFFEDVEEKSTEVRREFRVNKKRVKKTHTVVDADLRQLPAEGVSLNVKAEAMIGRIMQEKELAPYFGIVTGMLVETEEEITKRWEEETELKKALRVIRKKVGYKVEEAEEELKAEQVRLIQNEETIRRYMMVADPAICFGNDVVFYGWK